MEEGDCRPGSWRRIRWPDGGIWVGLQQHPLPVILRGSCSRTATLVVVGFVFIGTVSPGASLNQRIPSLPGTIAPHSLSVHLREDRLPGPGGWGNNTEVHSVLTQDLLTFFVWCFHLQKHVSRPPALGCPASRDTLEKGNVSVEQTRAVIR